MLKNLLLLISFVVIVAVGLVAFQNNQNEVTVNSFEECVAAGYPIAESYPEQCFVPDGPSFTREIN